MASIDLPYVDQKRLLEKLLDCFRLNLASNTVPMAKVPSWDLSFSIQNSISLCRHSGPQGKVVPLTIIDDPADWKAKDWEGREAEYTYFFTPEDIFELAAAVDALKARGISTEDDIIAVSQRILDMSLFACTAACAPCLCAPSLNFCGAMSV